jgi:hypothetical protein
MHLQVIVGAIPKQLRPARTEVGESGNELLWSRGGCQFELYYGHVCSLIELLRDIHQASWLALRVSRAIVRGELVLEDSSPSTFSIEIGNERNRMPVA